MTARARSLSWWDTARFQRFVTVPTLLWGLVVPNRRFVSWLCRGSAGQATIRFLDELRRTYGSDRLWVWFPGGRTLLVLDPESIEAVLRSDANAADPMVKTRALSHFVPDALVISSGDAWLDRRGFNERVLAFGQRHPHAEAFTEIAFAEVERLTTERSTELRWADFQTLAERISHQVLLGAGRVEPDMTAQLGHLARRGNLPILPRHRRSFSAFYGQIEQDLARHRARIQDGRRRGPGGDDPAPGRCLVHESAALLEDGRATGSTRVERQIGFWFFVLKDALEQHVARTLALIAAHPDVQDVVRAEIRAVPALSAAAIDGLRHLDACLREELRLWTPVPLLLRRAVTSFTLPGDVTIAAGQQILIHAGHHHRDPGLFGESANQFSPGTVGTDDARVLFFSRHRQSCAGQFLARSLVKATLAALLASRRFDLVAPTIVRERIPCLYDHFKIVLRPRGDA